MKTVSEKLVLERFIVALFTVNMRFKIEKDNCEILHLMSVLCERCRCRWNCK